MIKITGANQLKRRRGARDGNFSTCLSLFFGVPCNFQNPNQSGFCIFPIFRQVSHFFPDIFGSELLVSLGSKRGVLEQAVVQHVVVSIEIILLVAVAGLSA